MWPAAVVNHLNAGKPMQHEWALSAVVKTYGNTPANVRKSLWTGDHDLAITLDGNPRTYEGAFGGVKLRTIRYRTGTYVMAQELSLGVTDKGKELVLGHNTRNAPCDIWCLCYDPADMTYLGARRFFKGFIDGSHMTLAKQGGANVLGLKLVSHARKGTMTTVGYKAHQTQQLVNPNDDFYKLADLGRIASDPWGTYDG